MWLMQVYNVDFKRLALLLMPTALRKPILFALLKSACKVFGSLQGKLFSFQDTCNVRIKHTSQVCYLKGILYDTFCKGIDAHFEIVDTQTLSGEWLMTYEEGETYSDIIPLADNENPLIVYSEDAINETTEDFAVLYPANIGIEPDTNEYRQMVALVDQYRLASKIPQYRLQD